MKKFNLENEWDNLIKELKPAEISQIFFGAKRKLVF